MCVCVCVCVCVSLVCRFSCVRMNLFVLNEDPKEAASGLCDTHVVKMGLEAVQILCTVRIECGLEAPYRATHRSHPCVMWARECAENYMWVCEWALAIFARYTEIYNNKQHKSEQHARAFAQEGAPSALARLGARTPFPCCVAPELKERPLPSSNAGRVWLHRLSYAIYKRRALAAGRKGDMRWRRSLEEAPQWIKMSESQLNELAV